MNKVILTGRITHDLERRTTQNGTAVCQFDIAVDRPNKNNEADFIRIVAWDKTADFVLNYLGKGRKVAVLGSLRTRTYEDRDTGKKIKVVEVHADNIEFADSRPQGPFAGDGGNNGNGNGGYGGGNGNYGTGNYGNGNGGYAGNNGYNTGGNYHN